MFYICSYRSNGRMLVLAGALGIAAFGARAAPAGETPAANAQAVCETVDRVAAANRLSAAFLTRILWQESRFRSDALSPKGAEGVAQFMPPTAADRGLADPWNPAPAIAAAGSLLAQFAARFGNVGLAAAAYNAGAGRVDKWLRAETGLPEETRAYVRRVTGRPIEDWTVAARSHAAQDARPVAASCLETVAAIGHSPNFAAPPLVASPLDRLLTHALSLAESQQR
jgi:soluble lytic murein transglycosylase-like protein